MRQKLTIVRIRVFVTTRDNFFPSQLVAPKILEPYLETVAIKSALQVNQSINNVREIVTLRSSLEMGALKCFQS